MDTLKYNSLNQFYGTLVEEPKFKTSPKGSEILILTICYETWSSSTKEGDKLNYLTIQFWKSKANLFRNKFVKGDKVLVAGEIYQSRWKNKLDQHQSRFLLNGELIEKKQTSDLSPTSLEEI